MLMLGDTHHVRVSRSREDKVMNVRDSVHYVKTLHTNELTARQTGDLDMKVSGRDQLT